MVDVLLSNACVMLDVWNRWTDLIPCLPAAQELGSRDSVNFTVIVVFNVVGARGLSQGSDVRLW